MKPRQRTTPVLTAHEEKLKRQAQRDRTANRLANERKRNHKKRAKLVARTKE